MRMRLLFLSYLLLGPLLISLTLPACKSSAPKAKNRDSCTQNRNDSPARYEQFGTAYDISDAGNRRPIDLALTSDGSKLVVVRDIRNGTDDPFPGISMVDLDSGEVQSTILPEEGRSTRLAIHPNDDRAYMTISTASGSTVTNGRNRVDVIDLRSGAPEFERSIHLEEALSQYGPIGIALSPDGETGYVADRGTWSVHVIKTAVDPNPVSAVIQTSGVATGLAVTPDGSRVYVANRSPQIATCIDVASNSVGGSACRGIETFPVSVGPSTSSCDIVIAPDGKRAFITCNRSDPCVSVIDIDPESSSFNQEVSLISTTGEDLESTAISQNSQSLFVVSRSLNELLVIDTLSERQVQRAIIDSVADPIDVVFRDSMDGKGSILVADRAQRQILVFGQRCGPMLGPCQDSDLLIDSDISNETCPVESTPDEPDPGVDEMCHIRTHPIDPNCKLITVFEEVWEVCVNPNNPFDFIVYPPPGSENENSGLLEKAFRNLRDLLDMSPPVRYEVSAEELTLQLRPSSFKITSISEDGSAAEDIVRLEDGDGNGLAETVKFEGSLFTPDLEWSFQFYDSDGDGLEEYVGWPLDFGNQQIFLPLADTNGDGLVDSSAFDFDRNGRPDPDMLPFPFVTGPPNPESDFQLYFAQFGDGGSERSNVYSQILLFNLDPTSSANITIRIRDDDGNPLTVDLDGEEVQGIKTRDIPPGGLILLKTDGIGELVTGSVTVESNRALAGVILFGGSQGVAGVGASRIMAGSFLSAIETDSERKINTGIAIQNVENSTQNLDLVLRSSEGLQIANADLSIPAFGHQALFVSELDWQTETNGSPDFDQFRGLVEVNSQSSGDLAATVIQTRPQEFATLPVSQLYPKMNGNPGVLTQKGMDQRLYFAQFGDGRSGDVQITSEIQLINLTGAKANVQVLIRKGNGEPLEVDLNGETVTGELAIEIPAEGFKILQTDGLGDLQVGSVAVKSDRALNGVILFSGTVGTAGVGSSISHPKGFLAAVEKSSPDTNTGIAVMNLSEASNSLSIRLLNQSSVLLATAQLNLVGRGHRALYFDEIAWNIEPGVTLMLDEFEGLIEVRGEAPTAATVIQTRRGVFATQPVVSVLGSSMN